MVALVLMGMLPEELRWEYPHAIGHGFCLSVCTLSGPMRVFACCHIQHMSLVQGHCCSCLLQFDTVSLPLSIAGFLLFFYTHTFQSLESLWMNCEPWLRWMSLVTVGTADVLVPPTCSGAHTRTHAVSHLAVCSLAYILLSRLPLRPHAPLTHNALLPPRPGSISHAWCQ